MTALESVDLSLSYGAVWFIIALLLSAGYTYFVYRYTIPPVRPVTKLLLTVLRSLALLLLIFFIFEPVLILTGKEVLQPVHLIFIDDSRSMAIDDGTGRTDEVKRFIDEAGSSDISGRIVYYKFGSETQEIEADSLSGLSFGNGATNFYNVLQAVKQNDRNVASVTIISDGTLTAGSTPFSDAERLNMPLFTIGVGDTSVTKDISTANALYNEYIYAGSATTITAEIAGRGFEGRKAVVSFFEDDKSLEQKEIVISEDGYQSVSFSYKPETGGEKKLKVSVSSFEEEKNKDNNRKVFYVNVLDNKIKVLLVSGAPSQDLSFIRSSLNLDENLDVSTITVLGQNKIVENINVQEAVDSADILFLIGFPSGSMPAGLNGRIAEAVNNKNKPYFFILQSFSDYGALSAYRQSLSFSFQNSTGRLYQVQPFISMREKDSPLLQNDSPSPVDSWNNLPPVFQPPLEFSAKPGSEVLAEVKINNVPVKRPLIITRRLGSSRSISLLAFDIWKWKLQTAPKEMKLFDSFILNSVKWLNTENDRQQLSIRTSKKLYARGETVEFTAQAYDEAFNPVTGAEIKVKINGPEMSEILLNSLGSGLYEGSFTAGKTGDYTFSGTAAFNGKRLGISSGRFNIGEVDIEMTEIKADYNFLSTLAAAGGGEFYPAGSSTSVFENLNRIDEKASREKINVTEINLWAEEWMLALVLLLFAAEWFIRKRAGML